MGKKVKKKARSVQKEKRVPSPSPKVLPEQCGINVETPENDGVAVVKDRGVCPHIDRGIDLDKLSAKLDPSEHFKCEDCRGSALDRRAGRGKNKQGKKGGINSKSESKAIWICLGCGHFSCGGIGLPTTQNSHAVRHARQNHHPLAIHSENLQLLWCFPCDKLVTFEKREDMVESRNVIHKVAKMLKARPSEGSTINVEDVWFGIGSGTSAIKSEYSISNQADERVGYSIRGLINLGNSCFFNSVMQNLLAINELRNCLFELDESVGPLSASLRKLFLETSPETGLKGVINPRSFFDSLCSKAPQFRGYQQQDSHELLRCLLDGLCTEELSAVKHVKSSLAEGTTSIAKTTFIDAIFGGQLSSTVCCLECGHASTIYEPFLDLSLPIPTKKPPSKRMQPVTRGKKIKPPPKQGGRMRSKVNRDERILPTESVSEQSTFIDNNGEVQPRVPPAELPGDSASSMSIDLNTVALDMGLTHQDISHRQEAKNRPEVNNVEEQSVSTDVLTWLDYLEPNQESNDYDVASETYEMSADQGSADKNVFQNDVSLAFTLASSIGVNLESESAVSTMPLDSSCQFNLLDQGIVFHQQDASSQDVEKQNEISQSDEKLSTDHSSIKEVVKLNAHVGHSSELCRQICLIDPTVDACSSGWDDEKLSQVKESEVILLPYKEDVSSSFALLGEELEITSVVVGDEQGSQEFDGFGDLFNEPEVTLELGPSYACEVTDAVNNGVVGNSSDSDPGEVDNSDAPVSVESCLAFFTKPELLSKDEHAWECDNCSKVLQLGTRRKLRKLKSKIVPIGCNDINANGPLESCGNNLHEVEIISGMLENDAFDGSNGGLVPHNQEIHDISNSMLSNHQETKMNMKACQSENQESVMPNFCRGLLECSSFNSQILDSCCGKRDADSIGLTETDLLPEKCESEVSEGEEVDSKTLKVKRDATKSILISRAPSVLTIHLKRFSQDARGRLSKLNGHVNFRDTIDLNPYLNTSCTNGEKRTYRLLGAVEHSGSMRSGHYVAYVRGGQGDSTMWYYASDTHVCQVPLEKVLSCDAYILFYERT
ncbi:ubiquitin carboxyl-terminal hydrolase 2-like [Dorcoceras hygrometricum]|uniref:ubiquitinyl hydrolase 1 n=1 Tax=Dorcoceras hygrometricum TaxID=472368 RepID=A0A2Z7ATL5_9LAMI|nr:ubiquitin carboxyl-terminal hydrolase 2-like [Dorcoceras hygrometricum]